ncbi:unnamed protein product [Pseudo-nitzschia multistriata]|uniref:Uncharacterized protein n=1 Tax=Pseudo-nitzschia multistriata TaxID=183589 RepID=A0A448Z2W6_9STRA|nr:unnamed protein product [Pseudo-nitzschia multistriata]
MVKRGRWFSPRGDPVFILAERASKKISIGSIKKPERLNLEKDLRRSHVSQDVLVGIIDGNRERRSDEAPAGRIPDEAPTLQGSEPQIRDNSYIFESEGAGISNLDPCDDDGHNSDTKTPGPASSVSSLRRWLQGRSTSASVEGIYFKHGFEPAYHTLDGMRKTLFDWDWQQESNGYPPIEDSHVGATTSIRE